MNFSNEGLPFTNQISNSQSQYTQNALSIRKDYIPQEKPDQTKASSMSEENRSENIKEARYLQIT